MNIAFIKPDYKIYGGFEVVVDRLCVALQKKGFNVDIVKIDMTKISFDNNYFKIQPEVYYQNEDFFKYVLSYELFQNLKLDKYDIVISTQPPSYAISHPKTVCLFYHHMKIYYDLFDICKEVGLYKNSNFDLSKQLVREIDAKFINDSKYYITGSKHVMKRLKEFNQIEKNAFCFYAGVDDDFFTYKGDSSFKHAICVGRHEFPKRVELFIQAMKYLSDEVGVVVGEGGRTQSLKQLDILLTYMYMYEKKEIDSEMLWKNIFFNFDNYNIDNYKNVLTKTKIDSNVNFVGRVSNLQLKEYYANALCVVCPAYEEDYGLTAIEAMTFGKPVIACEDGGGYVELIEEGKTGFIVEPTGEAIAKAIKKLRNDPDLLRDMSNNARIKSNEFRWEKCSKSFVNIIQTIMEE